VIPVQHFSARPVVPGDESHPKEPNAEAGRSRRRILIAGLAVACVIGIASLRAHYVLAAHTPNDMHANSRWIFTGRDSVSNNKLGLWIACWKSTIKEVDHCRITNEKGATQFDSDMLPLSPRQGAVADRNLQLAAKIDPAKLWVRGASYDRPVPVLPLANGTQLVPIADREGLQKRLAHGKWNESLQPTSPAIAGQ